MHHEKYFPVWYAIRIPKSFPTVESPEKKNHSIGNSFHRKVEFLRKFAKLDLECCLFVFFSLSHNGSRFFLCCNVPRIEQNLDLFRRSQRSGFANRIELQNSKISVHLI